MTAMYDEAGRRADPARRPRVRGGLVAYERSSVAVRVDPCFRPSDVVDPEASGRRAVSGQAVLMDVLRSPMAPAIIPIDAAPGVATRRRVLCPGR